MGIAAVVVIVVLLCGCTALFALWRSSQDAVKVAVQAYDQMRLERNQWFDGCQAAQKRADQNAARNTELEQEILRLRKNPLTAEPKQADDKLIRAKSAADVRRLTEQAWGVRTEAEKEVVGDN